MDILTLMYEKTIEAIGNIGETDYAFFYRLHMIYICILVATSFSFRKVGVRSESLQWAIALIGALGSFFLPVYAPTDKTVTAYIIIICSLLILGAIGTIPFYIVETKLKQRRLRRIGFAILLILVMTHLIVRRHLP